MDSKGWTNMIHRTTRMLAAWPTVSSSMGNNDWDSHRLGTSITGVAVSGVAASRFRIQGKTWTRKNGATPTIAIKSPAYQPSSAIEYRSSAIAWSRRREVTPTTADPSAADIITSTYHTTSRRWLSSVSIRARLRSIYAAAAYHAATDMGVTIPVHVKNCS